MAHTHTSSSNSSTSSISTIRLPLTTVGRVCRTAAESDSSDIDLISELLPIKCQRMQHLGAVIYWQHVNSAAGLIIHRRVCSGRHNYTATHTATVIDTDTDTDTVTYEHCRKTRKWWFRLCFASPYLLIFLSTDILLILGWQTKERGETEEGSYVPNMYSIVKIVKELGNLHSCLAYFSSTSLPSPCGCVLFYIFAKLLPFNFRCCCLIDREKGKWLAARTNHQCVCRRRCQCQCDDEWWTARCVAIVSCLCREWAVQNYCLRILRFSNQSIIASINQSTVNTVSSTAAIAAADAAINLANISLSDSVNSQANRLPVLRGVFLVNTDLLLYSGIFMLCRCWQGTSSHKESVAQALPVCLFVYYKSYNLVHLWGLNLNIYWITIAERGGWIWYDLFIYL